jgi:phage tail-like protein
VSSLDEAKSAASGVIEERAMGRAPVAVRPMARNLNPGASAERALGNSCFYVDIGRTKLLFAEMSGLQLETEVTDYMEGGLHDYVHRLPGRTKLGNLVLKRGMAPSQEFMDWYLKIVAGNIERQNVSVKMHDLFGRVIVQWDFQDAYPVKWTGPSFVAKDNMVAIESLELAYGGLLRVV